MANLTDIINKKLDVYLKTAAGTQKVKDWAKANPKKAAEVGVYASDAKILKEAQKLRVQLFEAIKSRIKSFDNIDDIVIGKIIRQKNGEAQIELKFRPESLQRESLNPNNDGVINILLLFTKGYTIPDTKTPPRGNWKYKGNVIHKNVTALKHRNPDPFLNDMVNVFNSDNSNKGTAILVEKYK